MYCKQCGTEITDSTLKKCPKCNTAIGKGGRFCEFCGKPKKNPRTQCECQSKKETQNHTEVKKNEKVQPQSAGAQKHSENNSPSIHAANQYQKKFLNNLNTEPEPEEKLDGVQGDENNIQTSNPLYAKIAAQPDKKNIVEIVGEKMIDDLIGVQIKEPQQNNSRHKNKTEYVERNSANKERKAKPEVSQGLKNESVPAPVQVPATMPASAPVPNPVHASIPIPVSENEPVNQNKDGQTNSEGNVSNASNTVDKFFPDAFNEENFTVPQPEMPKIKKDKKYARFPPRNKINKKKHYLEFFWLASLICALLSFSQANMKIMFCLVGFSAVFALIDSIISEKKYGIGILIGLFFEVGLCFI